MSDTSSPEPIQLPIEHIRENAEPVSEVIVVKKSTAVYVSTVIVFVLGAYLLGFMMATAANGSGSNMQAVSTLVKDSIGTSVAQLAQSNSAAAPVEPTRDPNVRYDVPVGTGVSRGPEDAPITIIEFSDFQCPFCQRFHQTTLVPLLKQYEGKVRFVYRHFPLTTIHPYAGPAAEASECARDQGKFWEFHDFLFNNQDQIPSQNWSGFAKQVGLDTTAFEACISSRKNLKLVQDDYNLAVSLGLTGTPSFFVNGRILIGAQPLSAFQALIEAELASKKS